jgi:hypothetical protein
MVPDRDCPVCGSTAKMFPAAGAVYQYRCLRCGDYRLIVFLEGPLRERRIQNIGAISGWIRRQNAIGILPLIEDEGSFIELMKLTKPPLRERVELYLLAAAAKTTRLDQLFSPATLDLIGISYSDEPSELSVILSYLQGEELITDVLDGREARRLTPKGYIAADELRKKRTAHSQAFVAMLFTDEMKPVYDQGFEPGIRNAGFSPMLIRNKEHANKIDDEIIAEIRRSAFLVADFTGHRQNVYFETGFAIGLDLRVIWTCRKDQIKDLHFDIRQYNSIDWENPAELAKRLQSRIEAMLGRGPIATAPA